MGLGTRMVCIALQGYSELKGYAFLLTFFFSFNQNCAFLIDYYVTVHVVRFLGTK